jgi:predicted esterase YcpF (UPF0227 family)
VKKKILFLHGKESGPTGSKARWLAERYGAVTPAIDTSVFETAVTQARDAVTREKPDLVIGSSRKQACAWTWRPRCPKTHGRFSCTATPTT